MKKSAIKRIQKLPIQLANQIAAGEVIERPASVLKELLENSIDAGATVIEVTLLQGGQKLIRVQDDGCGICKEDLALALSQHATSKIATLSDLESVRSLGFRGEALASIAAVSRLSLTSAIESQETGWTIKMEGREHNFVLKPAPFLQGTIVEVRDLFYNTPARRKFLRSERTEFNHVEEVFKRIALSKPHVAFVLKQGDKQIKRLPACFERATETHRVAAICGHSFTSKALYVEAEANGLKLRGWLGSPEAHRAQADLQYFYVNGRIVRDKVINHALRHAYQTFCPPGRHSAYLLYFELDPEAVDVNVHPTKHEVRFREARSVHAFLTYSIQEALLETEKKKEKNEARNSNNDIETENMKEENKEGDNKNREFNAAAVQHKLWDDMEMDEDGVLNPVQVNPASVASVFADSVARQQNVAVAAVYVKQPSILRRRVHPITLLGDELMLASIASSIDREEEDGEEDGGIGENKSLIVADIKELKKSHFRVLLNEAYKSDGIAKKPLLIPQSIAVTKEHIHNLNDSDINWQKLGFEYTQIAPEKILLRAVPYLLSLNFGYDDNTHFMINLLQKTLIQDVIEVISNKLCQQEMTIDEMCNILESCIKLESEHRKMSQSTYQKMYQILKLCDLKKLLFS